MVGNKHYCGRNKSLHVTYRCPSNRHICANKEINRDYIDSFVINLLEREIFNKQSLKKIVERIEERNSVPNNQEDSSSLSIELEEINQALKNVADAIASGLISDALISKLKELELQKESIEQRLNNSQVNEDTVTIDTDLILSQYRELKESPLLPSYRDFIANFIDKISVGKYRVEITLKTGLDIYPALDTSYTVRRQEIYERRVTA